MGSHMRVLFLLMCLFGFSNGMHTLSFMAAKVSLNVCALIIIHLYDLICEGSWEDKEACIYYTDFVMVIVFFWSFVHVYGNNWLSVADLIILRQLRFFSGNAIFSMATMEELAPLDDRCAICWENMYTAYKLPCGHLFHNSCLPAVSNTNRAPLNYHSHLFHFHGTLKVIHFLYARLPVIPLVSHTRPKPGLRLKCMSGLF
uniref:RING-type domain-containing protein n=1 Tax=Cyprinus carpio carpio TaxID=630221 RepID=A0A8C1CBT9_CYPCA